MPAEDLSSAAAAPPPLAPLGEMAVVPDALVALGGQVVTRTWALGVDRWFWGEGVALCGMTHYLQAADPAGLADVRAWMERHLGSGLSVEHVNDLAPGIAALLVDTDGTLTKQLAPLVTWARGDASRGAHGVIEHWPGSVWADTAFMAGTFLARYGAATGDEALFVEAGRQLLLHGAVLQHPRTALFAHGAYAGSTIWSFWGRANAWTALAAVEYLEAAAEIGANSGPLTEISDRLVAQLRALAALQPAHGVWDVLVDGPPETAGILETSAAAGIGAAMLRAARVLPDLEDIERAGHLAIRGALAYVDADGVLERVSAGTVLQLVPFGYSVIRDDRPQLWGQGLALEAIAALLGDRGRTR